MRLPNAERAAVDAEKITAYLLNAAHPDNGGKAAFFAGLGFGRGHWTALAVALQKLAATTEARTILESAHVTKYIQDGRLETPSGKTAVVRTIWIVDRGADCARLVTAYPHEE